MRKFTFLIFLACLGFSASVRADYIEPNLVNIRTEKYIPEFTKFPHGTYVYDVTWQGIPVASAWVQVAEEGGYQKNLMRVRASAESGSFVSLFYNMRHTSESVLDSNTLSPLKFVSYQIENSKEKLAEVSFHQGGLIRSRLLKGGKEKQSNEFRSENFTLDPISAAFVARTIPLEIGKEAAFDVYNGKHRYLINFLVEKREAVSIDNKSYDAYKVIPRVQKLTDSEGEKRLESAALWVTADKNRDVVKLESKVFVGKVSAKLSRFIPSGSPGQIVLKDIPKPPVYVATLLNDISVQ